MQGICTTHLFVPLTSPKVGGISENSQIYLEFYSLIRTFETSLEGRLQLGNTKKKVFSFGISLVLHYLCSGFSKSAAFILYNKVNG